MSSGVPDVRPSRGWVTGIGCVLLLIGTVWAARGMHRDTLRFLERCGDAHGVVARSLRTAEFLRGDVQVVVTGSSQVREAFDPDVFARAGVQSANLGSSSKNPCRGLPDQPLVRGADLEVLVVGVSYFDLHDRNCSLLQPRLLGAAGGALSPDLAGILSDEDSAALQRGARLPWEATRPWIRDMVAARLQGEPLPPADSPPWRYAGRATEPLSTLVERWRGGREMFDVVDSDGPAYRALLRTVNGARDAGAAVVIVAMPLHPGVTQSERSPDAYQSLRDALVQLEEETGALVIDWEDEFAPDQFFDITHLNERGRATFSAALFERLADAFEAVP